MSDNINVFVRDLRVVGVVVEKLGRVDDYLRYALSKPNVATFTVLMPDVALEQVRCFHGSNVAGMREVYVQDEPWLWHFALRAVRDRLRRPVNE